MQFLCSIWKISHLTEYFYTGTAHGARNNYQVCPIIRVGHKDGNDDMMMVMKMMMMRYHLLCLTSSLSSAIHSGLLSYLVVKVGFRSHLALRMHLPLGIGTWHLALGTWYMGWELGTLVILHLALGIWQCAFQFWSVAATFCFLTYDQACLLIQTNKQTNARMKQTTNATNKQMQQTSKCNKQQMQPN